MVTTSLLQKLKSNQQTSPLAGLAWLHIRLLMLNIRILLSRDQEAISVAKLHQDFTYWVFFFFLTTLPLTEW